MEPACTAAEAIAPNDDTAARAILRELFRPLRRLRPGPRHRLFRARIPRLQEPAPGYNVPLYAKPADDALASLPRSAIDAGALNRKTPVTAYVASPVDAFMLQIQGSGRILLPNGRTLRVGFDGQNGQPYTPIGRILVQRATSRRTMSATKASPPG